MYTLAKELNIPPHELINYPISLVTDLMTIFSEVKLYEADLIDKSTNKTSGTTMSSNDGINFG
jgi:hypothetical protein|tara:strand:+ start:553 stop:741 length:189 start_codon:yes stop_codon:yes gene_type:complete